MKIYSDPFVKYATLINSFYSSADFYTSSLFFNLKDQYVYVKSDMGIIGRFRLLAEGIEGESFMIDSKKFLNLAQNYSELDFNDSTFSYGEETFQLNVIKGEDLIPNNLFLNNTFDKELFIDQKMNRIISNAKYYLDKDSVQKATQTIFIHDGSVYSTSDNQLYQYDLDNKEHELNIDISWVSFLEEGCSIRYHSEDNHLVKVTDSDTLEIVIPTYENVVPPPIHSPAFVEAYTHDTYFAFRTEELKEVMAFFNPYLSEIVSSKVRMTIKDQKLIIETFEKDLIKRVINVKSNIEELTFVVNFKKFDPIKNKMIQGYTEYYLIDREGKWTNLPKEEANQKFTEETRVHKKLLKEGNAEGSRFPAIKEYHFVSVFVSPESEKMPILIVGENENEKFVITKMKED